MACCTQGDTDEQAVHLSLSQTVLTNTKE